MGRYLNPVYHNPRRITKADKDFAMRLDFKDIKIPVKIKDIQKSKKRITLELVFLAVKLKESIQSMYQKKCCNKKYATLLLIGETEKKHYVLIKDFNRYIYDDSLHRGRKKFCRYCLHVFITKDNLKRH